jgi:hypothetical protein
MSNPLIKKHFTDPSTKKNVFQKSFTNGSIIYLGYADTEASADRVRGVNADSLLMDEIQDISLDTIPILQETLAASPYAYKRFTGTAKNEGGSLDLLWKRSCQNEWVTKCTHCGKYAVPHDLETCLLISSSKLGPSCPHCFKPIDITTGQWVSMKPSNESMGFHMPQIIFGSRVAPNKWADLQEKIRDYSLPKLCNEVFGIASGSGGRILSLTEARNCCNPDKKEFDTCWPTDYRGLNQVVIGCDWSVTGTTKSFTAFSVIGSDYMGKLYLLHSEIVQGTDILDQVKRAADLYTQFNCQIMSMDRGVGKLQWELLANKLGHDKVVSINYVTAKNTLRWDKDGRYYAADRTSCIDSVIMKFKLGRKFFEAPSFEITGKYWDHALCMFEEESRAGKRLYRKDDDGSDDWVHSVVFANIGLMILRGDFTYTNHDDE